MKDSDLVKAMAAPRPRKIVGIAIEPHTADQYGRIWALADDGTIFVRFTSSGRDQEWDQMLWPPLPPQAATSNSDQGRK